MIIDDFGKALCGFLCLTGPILHAQTPDRQPTELIARPTQVQIVVDGELNEDVWKSADVTSEFWQNFPYDTSRASIKTLVRVTYDHEFIYISAECYDESPDK